ncbi:MAG: Crp/Fnr family transcriptional regulator [Acidobacteria bacterium]|nr:Crp/Fnr family transcriptional regulator [Acidobacteriota bacterium]
MRYGGAGAQQRCHELTPVGDLNGRSLVERAHELRPAIVRDQCSRPKNCILRALPAADYKRLLDSLEEVVLDQHHVLNEPGGIITHAVFPESSLISLITALEDGSSVEVAVIGSRGFSGLPLALGSRTCPYGALVQIGGKALQMKAAAFTNEFHRGGSFQSVVLAYMRCRIFMVSQHAACNRIHELSKRLARLLLRIHDELRGGEIPMTHESISLLLGAARPDVAMHAAVLRSAGAIDYSRSRIKVVDRKKLESSACECYSLITREFQQVFGKSKQPPKTGHSAPR